MNAKEFAAYLAGFTDGEGYIGLVKDSRGSGSTIAVHIAIANTVESVLKMIQGRLGYGYIASQHLRPEWSRRYTLQIRNMSDCLKFLTLVRPYLHIKAKAADDALLHIRGRMAFWDAKKKRDASIRKRAAAGETRMKIAADLGVSPQLVSHVCEGHKWPSVQKHLASKRSRDHRGLFRPILQNPSR